MSTTIGTILISYDVNSNHTTIKDEMKAKGYNEIVVIGGKNYRLPNTTLAKNDTSTDKALADLTAACLKHKTTLEKAVSVIGNDWVAYNQP